MPEAEDGRQRNEGKHPVRCAFWEGSRTLDEARARGAQEPRNYMRVAERCLADGGLFLLHTIDLLSCAGAFRARDLARASHGHQAASLNTDPASTRRLD